MPPPPNIDCLRRLRQMVRRGLSRYGTYRRLSAHVGVPAATLHRILKGKRVPSILLVDRLARALGETFSLGELD